MGGVAKTPGQELCSLLRPHEGSPEPGDMALLASPPHLMLDCTSYMRTCRPGVMIPILQVKELRLCKANTLPQSKGKSSHTQTMCF